MENVLQTDVLVIGGGITGTAILRELSRYNCRSLLIEKEPDLAMGTTKANSAIIHAGFDAPVGSLKAVLNVRGNELYHAIATELNLDVKWTGSLVVATTEEEVATLEELLARGKANGVQGLKILTAEETKAKEKNLTSEVKAALWAPTAGLIWPFGAALAFAQCAMQNGSEIIRECKVTEILTRDGKVTGVRTEKGLIEASVVIDAAGVYADEIASTCGDKSFHIIPRKGEYILFDKSAQASLVQGIVFPVPTKVSKGCLVCATTHGNVFIGPNAIEGEDKEDNAVTNEGMQEIIASARKLLPNLPMGAAITEFAGLRAVADTGDFVIRPAEQIEGLIYAAGMQSPGLSAAPAVAEYVVKLVQAVRPLEAKATFQATLPAVKPFSTLSAKEQGELIAKDKRYGRIICRCESITEGEIVSAIKAPCGAVTVDGVKRRMRAGMGRCQGGFCGPRVVQIIARELGIPVEAVRKDGRNSYLYYPKAAQSEEA